MKKAMIAPRLLPITDNKPRQLLLFISLLSSNLYYGADGFSQCRTRTRLPRALFEARAFSAERTFVLGATTTVTMGSRDRNGTISIDDAIASMGLTQVNKKGGVKGGNLDTERGSGINKHTKGKGKDKGKGKIKGKDKDKGKGKVKGKVKGSTSGSININNNKKEKDKSGKDTKKKPQSVYNPNDVPVPLETQLDYSREGHASLREFLPPDMIEEVYRDLKAYSTDKEHRRKGEDTAPFLQFYNTWRDLPSVRRLAESPLLCRAACTLLNLPISSTMSSSSSSSDVKLRLYQDSVFIKRKNKDGITPWHIDGRMMPFDTSYAITFWIPLHAIPSIHDGGTGLLFINKSHSDFSLPYWNGRGTEYNNDHDAVGYNAYDHLTTRYGIQNVADDRIADNNPGVIDHHMPLNVGDCTVHNGWTMHCANGNNNNNTHKNNKSKGTAHTRYAIAITYVDSRAEVRGDIPGVGKNLDRTKKHSSGQGRSNVFLGDAEDSASYAAWIGDVLPRTRFEHRLLPDVWPSSAKR